MNDCVVANIGNDFWGIESCKGKFSFWLWNFRCIASYPFLDLRYDAIHVLTAYLQTRNELSKLTDAFKAKYGFR